MKHTVRLSKVIAIGALLLWIVPSLFMARIEPNEIGVRQSAIGGVSDDDCEPGWHWRVPGVHKLIILPSAYFMLDYTDDDKGPQKPLVIGHDPGVGDGDAVLHGHQDAAAASIIRIGRSVRSKGCRTRPSASSVSVPSSATSRRSPRMTGPGASMPRKRNQQPEMRRRIVLPSAREKHIVRSGFRPSACHTDQGSTESVAPLSTRNFTLRGGPPSRRTSTSA